MTIEVLRLSGPIDLNGDDAPPLGAIVSGTYWGRVTRRSSGIRDGVVTRTSTVKVEMGTFAVQPPAPGLFDALEPPPGVDAETGEIRTEPDPWARLDGMEPASPAAPVVS